MSNIQKVLYLKLLNLLYHSRAGHIGSCLSCLDILTQVLIFEKKPQDKFLLSKGHAAPALYVVLNYLGVISEKELLTFYNDGTKLPGHTPNIHFKEYINFPTGSLGHGLSLCSGMAHALKLKQTMKNTINNQRLPTIYCLMSDGECNEGQVWEAAQYASHFKLSNLFVLIDKNGIQALGKTKDVLGDAATKEKWSAFNFEVFEADGHDLKKIGKAFNKAKKTKSDKPKVIIFNTIKGYGISFMQNTIEWHYRTMNENLYKKAIEEINQKYET